MNVKKREAIFQQWRSQILREARDFASLADVGQRALSDAEVIADPVIEGMIRAEIEERRSEFTLEDKMRDTPVVPRRTRDATLVSSSQAAQPPPLDWKAAFDAQARTAAASIEHGDEPQAAFAVNRLCELQREHSEFISVESVESYVERLKRLRHRLAHLEGQIDGLLHQALSAARRGDDQQVSQCTRRLSSLHAAHPRLLPRERLDVIREQIIQASDVREHREAAHRLVERERAVAAEIKKLADSVHQFHLTARSVPHDRDEYHRAEAAYLRVVREVRAHDREWLSGYILELADLLAAWGDPPPEAEANVDRFLRGVRASLHHIQEEIHEIEIEQEDEPQ
jgi:hypothetical protein